MTFFKEIIFPPVKKLKNKSFYFLFRRSVGELNSLSGSKWKLQVDCPICKTEFILIDDVKNIELTREAIKINFKYYWDLAIENCPKEHFPNVRIINEQEMNLYRGYC